MRRTFGLIGLLAVLLLLSACSGADGGPIQDDEPPTGDGDDTPDGDADDADGDDRTDGDDSRCPPSMHWDEAAQMCKPGAACPEGMRWDATRRMCVPDTGTEDGDLDEDGEQEEPDDLDEDLPDTFSCENMGLESIPFQQAASSAALYALAADVILPTRRGDWQLSERWSGCENYLFIQDYPRQASGWEPPLFSRDLGELLEKLPRNTHVFFLSVQEEAELMDQSFTLLDSQYRDLKRQMSEQDRAHWQHHLHWVTLPTGQLPEWLGQVFRSPRWGVGIDRFQRIRYIGSYADPTRYSSAQQWFGPNLAMAANEAVYYNFEARRESELDSQEAVTITVFDGEVLSDPAWEGVRGYAEVQLPDAETMRTFDSVELDLYMGCNGAGEYGTCPAWDYIVHLYLCDAEDPQRCNTEFGRWITTYHREGRWVHDVSPLLPLLAEGGTRRFAFYTQQPYEIHLKIRLLDKSLPLRPVQAIPLFTGGVFNTGYNDAYEPLQIDIPQEADAVALATVITGHGMANPGNCAEFCNTTHHFQVNESESVVSFPQAGKERDCQNQVDQGTVPNQYGTWWYGRSGWCPGKEVLIERHDVTGAVTPGQTAEIRYAGYFRDAPYSGGGANIVMTSWLVIYETRSDAARR